MKNTFHLSLVIGEVLEKMGAAQGQTEEAQAQTKICVPDERGSASPS